MGPKRRWVRRLCFGDVKQTGRTMLDGMPTSAARGVRTQPVERHSNNKGSVFATLKSSTRVSRGPHAFCQRKFHRNAAICPWAPLQTIIEVAVNLTVQKRPLLASEGEGGVGDKEEWTRACGMLAPHSAHARRPASAAEAAGRTRLCPFRVYSAVMFFCVAHRPNLRQGTPWWCSSAPTGRSSAQSRWSRMCARAGGRTLARRSLRLCNRTFTRRKATVDQKR